MKSPLILSADPRLLSQQDMDIITNKELIRANQDPESRQATCFVGCTHGDIKGYATTLSTQERVAVITNWDNVAHGSTFFYTPYDLGISIPIGSTAVFTDLYDQ